MGVMERVPAGGNSEDTIFPRVCVELVNRAGPTPSIALEGKILGAGSLARVREKPECESAECFRNALGIKEACSHLDHSCFTPQARRARRWVSASGLGSEILQPLQCEGTNAQLTSSRIWGRGRGVSSRGGAGPRWWRQIPNMAPERLRSRAVSAFKLRGLLLRG